MPLSVLVTGIICLLEYKNMIDAYEVHDDLEEMDEMIDNLANPGYRINKEVFGEDFVDLTHKLIRECYD